jgi:uncharacterized protein YjbK
MKHLIYILLIIATQTACNSEQNEDLVKEPNKDGSVETVITVAHENGYDILKTTHKVWVKGVLDKQIVNADTLKLLGTEAKEVEDENGNLQQTIAPKDYELYITVK